VGLGDLAALKMIPPDPQAGALVQAFNRMVEARWEER